MALKTTTHEKEAHIQHAETVDSGTSKTSSTEHVEKQAVVAGKEPSPNYVERYGGLRIDGDDMDHEHEPKVRDIGIVGPF
jgi:hypothetical protein